MPHHPEIALTGKARAYLLKRQIAALSLEFKPLRTCCVPYSPPPHITFGPPRRAQDFITFQHDGVTIHLDRALCDVERLTIDKHGFGIFSWFSVVDWRPLPP